MTGEKKEGFCLKCRKVFDDGKTKSLCPNCLKEEFRNMDNGDNTGYLYAAIAYFKYKNPSKEFFL